MKIDLIQIHKENIHTFLKVEVLQAVFSDCKEVKQMNEPTSHLT